MTTNIRKCGKDLSNMTKFQCEVNFGPINGAWLSLDRKSFSKADGLVESNWLDEVNKAIAERLFIFPAADDMIRNVEDAVFKEGNLTVRRKIRNGKVDLQLHYEGTETCVANVIATFDGFRGYMYAITENQAILGKKNGDNTDGMEVDVFASDPIPAENADDPWRVILYLYLVDTKGNFTSAILPDDESYNTTGTYWRPSDIEGLIDVTMTEDSVTATTAVVSIVGSCDEREVDDLVTADFLVKKVSDGSTVAVTVTNSGNVYTISGLTTATDYTIELKAPADQTTQGYETQAQLAVTTA